MITMPTTAIHRSIPPSGRLLLALLGRLSVGRVELVTPQGESLHFGDPRAVESATLIVHDWRAARAILRAGDIGFADAYRHGWVETPDLIGLLQLALRNEDALPRTVQGGMLGRLWYALRHRLRTNSRRGSRRNIHAHYDIGNDFYALWLDETMTYSSALYAGQDLPLADAQRAKYQRIVETLDLRPGMRVLEIGCGWGGFALHCAKQGIAVDGVTISQEQWQVALARADEAEVADRVQILLKDYRDLAGNYDAVVSIEMFEAVGEHYWPTYFETVKRCLKPGARALVQSITIEEARFEAYRSSSDFIRETIFPGGMLPSPERFIEAAGHNGLRAYTTLRFGLDYAHTLRVWWRNFEARAEQVRALGYDERFIRTWRLYLTYCIAGFESRRTDVVQFVLMRSAAA